MINFNEGSGPEKPIEVPTMPLDHEQFEKSQDKVTNFEKEMEILQAREHIAEGSLEILIKEIEIEIQTLKLENPDSLANKLQISRLEKVINSARDLLANK